MRAGILVRRSSAANSYLCSAVSSDACIDIQPSTPSSRVLVMTPRPGRIHAEVDIDAPRPRTDSFRGTPEFAAHSAQLSEMLGSAMQEAAQ